MRALNKETEDIVSSRTYAFAAALALLLLSGVLFHVLAGDSAQLDEAAARVALVPLEVGPWRGHDEPADELGFEKTGAKGYWIRHYVHQETRASVLVILMCGRAGKMAVHTPEVCYSGAGYQMYDQPTATRIADEQFWSAQFDNKGGRLRLHWAWNATGTWEASPSPRWQYRGAPYLYKLYVSREIAAGAKNDATAEFLRDFAPVLKQTLFP